MLLGMFQTVLLHVISTFSESIGENILLFPLNYLGTFAKQPFDHMFKSLSEFYVLFHWLIYLSLCQ